MSESPLVDPSKKVMATITIRVWSDEAMTIEGPLGDPVWCKHALEHALATINEKIKANKPTLGHTIPGKDVSLPDSPIVPRIR